MLPLESKIRANPLSEATQAHLASKQHSINRQVLFAEKCDRAQSLWGNKKQGAGQRAFKEIEEKLRLIAPSLEECCYCERNEGNDDEHIFPKSAYPERAFDWDNFLLACQNCNSNYKRNQFAVFDPPGSTNVVVIAFDKNSTAPPPSDDAAFINPRTENPLDFLEAVFLYNVGTCQLLPKHNLTAQSREWHKADQTKEILGLNRQTLPEARFRACQGFVLHLQKYAAICRAADFAALESTTNHCPSFDKTQPFEQEKQCVLASMKRYICTMSHPTVLKEMIRQRHIHPQFRALFEQLPDEVLTWV